MNPCDWPVAGWVCAAGSEAVSSLVEDGSVRVLSGVAHGVASFAAMLLESLWRMIQRATHPQTDADFLQQWAGMIFAIALPITVIFMVFQIIQSLVQARGWTRSGVFSAVSGAAVAVVGTAVSLPVVHGLTRMVDGAAEAMTGVILGDIDTLGNDFAAAIGGQGVSFGRLLTPLGQDQVARETTTAALGGLIGAIILGFLMILGGIAVFAALLIRSLLLYAVVVTGPIAFLGLVWTPARPWFRRWCVAVVALIFTKLGVVVVFGLGIAAMNNLDFGSGILEALGRLLTGALLMLIAAMVPIVAFRFFGFLGEEGAASLHSGAQVGVARTKDAFGHMDPRRIADRLHGHSGAQPPSSAHQAPDARPAQHAATSQQPVRPRSTPGPKSQGPANPWRTEGSPQAGTPGGGWSTPQGNAGSVRAAGSGSAGAGVGAVVGAGIAAGQKTAETGARAAGHVGQHQAAEPPSEPPPPPASSSKPRPT